MAGSRQRDLPARGVALGGPVVAVAALAVLATVAAASRIPWSLTPRAFWSGGREVTLPPEPSQTPLSPDDPLLQRGEPPAWLGYLVGVLLVAAAGLLAVWVARWLWRRRPRRVVRVADDEEALPTGPRAVAVDPERLRRGARDALDILDEVAEPRDAVIRSWLALETAARSAGAPRHPATSPTEFTEQVLTGTTADPDAVSRLLALYQRARFSRHEVGHAEVVEARACVLGLCRSWSAYEPALRASVPGAAR